MTNNYYYGFNFLWMYSKNMAIADADEKALDFMRSFNLNFVRIPTDYRLWTNGTDYLEPDLSIMEKTFGYFSACEKRNIHFCLNLHRAPGYCINGNNLETHNLWTDRIAQDGFVYIWETFAKMFKGISSDLVSFDLLNEPPKIGEYGMTRAVHRDIMIRTAHAIWAIDPKRQIVVDGLGGGNIAMPELAEMPVIQSTRGYQPMALTHFKAEWCEATKDVREATYPGTKWDGKSWNKNTIREHYKPWIDLQAFGVRVHVGELGCYNKVPNSDALRWYSDLFSLFAELKWGYAMWNFEGPFGIIGHGRPGTELSDCCGYRVDMELLRLYLDCRVAS